MNPIDRDNWRLAFIEHFRWWGISPDGIRFMGEESLLWPTENEVVEENAKPGLEGAEEARVRGRNAVMRLFHESPPDDGDSLYRQKAERSDSQLSYIPSSNILRPVGVQVPRMELWLEGDKQAAMFHFWLMDEDWRWMSDALGLIVRIGNHPRTISARMADSDHAAVEIHSVRTAMKRGELGGSEPHMVVVITQRRAGFFDMGKQKAKDQEIGAWRDPERDFSYRAGCTLLIDPEEMRIRRVIRTPGTVADDEHLDRLRRYLLDGLTPTDAFGSAVARFSSTAEPFAFLHSPGG